MDKNQILDQLKQINYPGFNRDIVSFGMVKDITVDNDVVKLELSISSQNEEKKREVIKSVKEKLSNDFTKVEISLKTDVSATSLPQQASSTKPILDNVKHIIAIARAHEYDLKNSVEARATSAIIAAPCVMVIPCLNPSVFLILGTNKANIATNTLAIDPMTANPDESTLKLWKKNKLINGIVRPAPIAIIKVGTIALIIKTQS